jgi:hypothetical protein
MTVLSKFPRNFEVQRNHRLRPSRKSRVQVSTCRGYATPPLRSPAFFANRLEPARFLLLQSKHRLYFFVTKITNP